MGWRDAFGAKDVVTVTLSSAALTLSLVSWRTALASGRHAAVASQMQLYLSEYVTALDAEPLAFAPCGYARTTPRNQERARLTLGLLIGLVEAMDAANDRRAPAWRARLADLKGPLYDPDWDPAVYAGTPAMATAIGRLRAGHLGPVTCGGGTSG